MDRNSPFDSIAHHPCLTPKETDEKADNQADKDTATTGDAPPASVQAEDESSYPAPSRRFLTVIALLLCSFIVGMVGFQSSFLQDR